MTGAFGFLGRYVVERLKGMPSISVIAPTRAEYDLRQRQDIRRLLGTHGPDVVIHLAARVGGIGANQHNPGTFFYENAVMGVELMEQSRLAAVRKFVSVGTVCAYPKYTPVPFREDELWNGYPEETNAPYGLAKKMLLVQGQAYRAQYGFNAIYLLPANLYGPGDSFDLENSHVIPAMITKFVRAKEASAPQVVLWGTGSPTREFLFVADAARAIVLAAERYDDGLPVNIGTASEISMRDLAHLIAELTGYSGRTEWDHSKPDGQPRRKLDVSRAREAFGFTAETDFRSGLRHTIEWYRDHVLTRETARP